MVGISDVAENALLDILFTAVAWANIADNASSSPITIVAWALHTGDPGDAGTQATSEAAYTSYARETPARSTSGHTITTNSMSPAANVDFTAGTGGSGTASHFSVGKTISGATDQWFAGTVTPNIVMGDGVTPRLTTASTVTLD
jgi:hypothetical protein